MVILENIKRLIKQSDVKYISESAFLELAIQLGLGILSTYISHKITGVNNNYVKELEIQNIQLAEKNKQLAEYNKEMFTYISHKDAIGFFGRVKEDLGITTQTLMQYGIYSSIALGTVLFFLFKNKIFENNEHIKKIIYLEDKLKKIAYSESMKIRFEFDDIINTRNKLIKDSNKNSSSFFIYLDSFFQIFSLLILYRISMSDIKYLNLSDFLEKNNDINNCLNDFKHFYTDSNSFNEIIKNLNLFFTK